jgi:hypothetical protein
VVDDTRHEDGDKERTKSEARNRCVGVCVVHFASRNRIETQRAGSMRIEDTNNLDGWFYL